MVGGEEHDDFDSRIGGVAHYSCMGKTPRK